MKLSVSESEAHLFGCYSKLQNPTLCVSISDYFLKHKYKAESRHTAWPYHNEIIRVSCTVKLIDYKLLAF